MQAATQAPASPMPPTPVAPNVPAIQLPGGRVIISGNNPSPSEIFQAFKQQRSELRDQLDRLENQRESISEQIRQPELSSVDKRGLEARLANIDLRIADTEKQIAEADANVARSAATPGAVVPDPPDPGRNGPPEEAFVLGGLFLLVVFLPLSIAFARRIWRRSAATVAALPKEIYERFNRLDQAIDSVAIEVERIGENQRYITRMYAEQPKGIGAGPAERIDTPDRERDRQRRGP